MISGSFLRNKKYNNNSYIDHDDSGNTMLFYTESKELISYLINEHELDINGIDLEMKTILFHSINKYKFEITKYLIEQCNIDVHIAANDGNLAFLYWQAVEMTTYVSNKCNIDMYIVNNYGRGKQKHLQFSTQFQNIMTTICNINIKETDKYNKTLIDIADEYLNVPQVQYSTRHTIYVIGAQKENNNNENNHDENVELKTPESITHVNLTKTNSLVYEEGENNEEEEKDVINIKTWLYAKDKLIDLLHKLFEWK